MPCSEPSPIATALTLWFFNSWSSHKLKMMRSSSSPALECPLPSISSAGTTEHEDVANQEADIAKTWPVKTPIKSICLSWMRFMNQHTVITNTTGWDTAGGETVSECNPQNEMERQLSMNAFSEDSWNTLIYSCCVFNCFQHSFSFTIISQLLKSNFPYSAERLILQRSIKRRK